MASTRAPPRAGYGNLVIEDLPLFPLNTVLFPGGRLPLRLFERRYLDMASACMRGKTPFGVCLIRAGHEVGAPATPHEIGTLARIVEWDMQQLGVLQVVAQGERRFRVLEQRAEKDGLIRARVELLAEEPASGIAHVVELLPLAVRQSLLELDGDAARLEHIRRLLPERP